MQIFPEKSDKISIDRLKSIPQTVWEKDASLDLASPYLYRSEHAGYIYDFLWIPKIGSKRLFVFFSGDAQRKRNNPPVFQRRSWTDYFPGHCLFFSDPALYLNETMGLAWYSGTKDSDFLERIGDIIANIAKILGVEDTNICSYGSSGGGFAALRLLNFLPKLSAVAINPQIILSEYEYPNNINRYAKTCFNMNYLDAAQKYPDRFNIIEKIDIIRNRQIVYVQNISDTHHYDIHYYKFCKAMGATRDANATNGPFRRIIFDHPLGHKKAETLEAFKAAIDIVTSDFSQ